MLNHSFLVAIVMGTVTVFSGCERRDSTGQTATESSGTFSGTYPIDVVATIGMVGDVVRNVGGVHVKVDQLCGPGVDPHLKRITTDDSRLLMTTDMIFYSGLMLEGKMTDALILASRSKPVFAVTELIDESFLLEPREFAGHYDPHVWNDVSAWSQTIATVESALADFDPDHTADYKANASKYKAKLDKLHQYGIDALATIPQESRILVTSHDAFNYFGRAYGLQVAGVQGLSTESEAGVQHINELVDLLVAKKVKAVFVESSVSPKNIQALAEGARSKGHEVVVEEENPLFSDAMGSAGTYEGTYEGMLDHNITIVARALGGNVDARGHNGKLNIPKE